MRPMQVPSTRDNIIILVKAGWPHRKIASAVGVSFHVYEREQLVDPSWAARVHKAAEEKYGAVEQHAIRLALQADAEGEMEGSHKALAQILKNLSADRERSSRTDNLHDKAELDAVHGQGRGTSFILATPATAAEFVKALQAGQQDDIIDIELEEGDQHDN